MKIWQKICMLLFFELISGKALADLNIAIVTPTDGDFKYFSEELINGAKIAVDKINETGGLIGKKVNLIQIEDACDDILSLTTAEMIAVNRSEDDKMHLIIGPQCGNQTENISKILSQSKIFQIHPIGSSSAFYENKPKEVVEFIGYTEQQGIDFFRFYDGQFSDKKLAVVYDSKNSEKTEIAKTIQSLFSKSGKGNNLTAFSLESIDGNLMSLSKSIESQNIDVLFLLGDAEFSIEAVRYLKTNYPHLVIFVNQYMVGKKFIRKIGEQEDIYIISLPTLSNNPNFAEDLVKLRLWGIEPTGLTAYGYLSVKLWENLVNSSGTLEYDKLQKSIDKKLIQTGWGNVIYSDGVPDRSLKYIIYKIEKGEYTQVY